MMVTQVTVTGRNTEQRFFTNVKALLVHRSGFGFSKIVLCIAAPNVNLNIQIL